MKPFRAARVPAAFALASACASACGGSAHDPRYPAREPGCPIKSFPAEPAAPVDELGVVEVECGSVRGDCERRAFDLVCRRGGDVAWGLADNALTATKVVVHAAHTHRALEGARARGCAVQVFDGTPPFAIENVGPVKADCSTDDSRETCVRELEDQACLLGGDVVWQIEGPSPQATSEGPKQRMRGRAAHTK
jgi:hypothetical protein